MRHEATYESHLRHANLIGLHKDKKGYLEVHREQNRELRLGLILGLGKYKFVKTDLA